MDRKYIFETIFDAKFVELYKVLALMVYGLLMLFLFKGRIGQLISALIRRIEVGSPIDLGPVSIGIPPKELSEGKIRAVTSDGNESIPKVHEIMDVLLNKKYPDCLSDEIYLIHASQTITQRTTPRSGRYNVRVWLEAYEANEIDDIERITYRLYDDFKEKIITTTSRANNFELWITCFGEFTLVAYAERKSKPPIWLTRYLDLPGRPTD
jgi:hypothetical protein